MFWNKHKIDPKMIPQLRPTSKAALKHQCLFMSKGDLEAATRLYEFMIKDMEDLPMFDPVKPSTYEQAKTILGEGFGWVKENQETIVNWVAFFKDTFGKKGGGGASSNAVPPING